MTENKPPLYSLSSADALDALRRKLIGDDTPLDKEIASALAELDKHPRNKSSILRMFADRLTTPLTQRTKTLERQLDELHIRFTDLLEDRSRERDAVREREQVAARHQAVALHRLIEMGVQIGTPVDSNGHGCSNCTWHLEGPDGYDVDGGQPTTFLNYLLEGTYGPADTMTLRPVRPTKKKENQ